MCLRLLMVMAALTFVIGRDCRAVEPRRAEGDYAHHPCDRVESVVTVEDGAKLAAFVRNNDYQCIETLLHSNPFSAPNSNVMSLLIELVQKDATPGQSTYRTIPNSTKLIVLGYLNLHVHKSNAYGFSLKQFADFIRAEAIDQSSHHRGKALSLLFGIMEESDIPVFVEAIQTGDDSLLVLGLYALAERCSPAAVKSLREVLKHQAVKSYMQRYSQTELITKKFRESCPAVIRQIGLPLSGAAPSVGNSSGSIVRNINTDLARRR